MLCENRNSESHTLLNGLRVFDTYFPIGVKSAIKDVHVTLL